MIEALSGRRSFERLKAEGVRHGRGRLRLLSRHASVHDPTQSARIGFAISRTVGNAVERNRMRRRVRAVLHELSRDDPSLLPGGDYLFRVTSPIGHWSPEELRHRLVALLHDSAMAGTGR
ncbi:MAG: ribonuclease P protein component [Acidimicrobiaceae bacterium]|nr:ribonuclease P protein component [Acidimicrobiia bacterium]MCY4492491.1 ribonuclease P protein component [Acidimicrobiaceae bacterium]